MDLNMYMSQVWIWGYGKDDGLLYSDGKCKL